MVSSCYNDNSCDGRGRPTETEAIALCPSAPCEVIDKCIRLLVSVFSSIK